MYGDDIIPADLLTPLLSETFTFAPIALAITFEGPNGWRFARVNDAYLKLTGLRWDEIRDRPTTALGASIVNPARERRDQLLATEGSYRLEEVDIRQANGEIIPTLISARRTVIDGVKYDVEIIIDVSERLREQKETEMLLRAQARTDMLTGLPNRACFEEVMAERLSAAGRPDSRLALAYLDLNGFKWVNDTLGHAAGDAILRMVGRRLRGAFATDFVARLGGDEFAVLLDFEPADPVQLQELLKQKMEHVFAPISVDGTLTHTGAAIGGTLWQEGDRVSSLVKRADTYMYAAKDSGARIGVMCVDPPPGTERRVRQRRAVPH